MRSLIFVAFVALFVGQRFIEADELPEITNSIGIKMKLIPAGTFTMGDAKTAPLLDNETPHKVTLTEPFYLGATEVTNAQWKAVMGEVPRQSKWRDADRPIGHVSRGDALAFCEELSAMPGERSAGRVYRLPTEAEWEYACRAGSTTKYSFGDDGSLLGNFAWFRDNSNRQKHPVGQKLPNAWGLYDMHGNVWEWCSDRARKYGHGAVTDPRGMSTGLAFVARGGNGADAAAFCRSAYRIELNPSSRGDFLGFRLALNPSEGKPPEAGK